MLVRFRGKSEALSRFHCFKSQYLYSTSARNAIFVKYLIDSLGFSKAEASLASSKVTLGKSFKKNPDLVLNFLKLTGFDKTQMKKLVSTSPKFLFYDVSKTLKPKIQCLMDIGLSGWDLVNVIVKDSTIVERGLLTHLKPTLNCLKRILGSDENVVKAIKSTSWLLSFGGRNVMENNLLLLKNYGVSDDKIRKIVLRNPRYITQKPEWVKDLLHRVEKDFGIPLHSSMFPYGFHTLASQKKARCEKKIEIFKSFGWSDDDILRMFRKLPYCIALSEVKIQKGLSLYMKELGFEPAYLASHPSILIYSMEKRVLPRMKVLKILDEKKLERRKMALYTAVSLKETKFIEYFVLPYKDQVPNLYEPLQKTLAP
ncbi:transcription termination factor MTERF5, chloroplastic-like [Solanum dulcamara]|uniref:transcription termination factor MTERF5, chloroplastic-like n=1 Tax=Solanum dulcamara TaxID=45834 RepID=UPI002486BCC8|nr:transcription termination factor MTERF5, chloroplastic-like [Solanum dulcamara]